MFLSFAEEDRNVAISRIKDPLEKKGYSFCWNYRAEKCIHESQVIVLLLSKSYEESEVCLTELQIAMKKNNDCIIPVMFDESLTILRMPEFKNLTYLNVDDEHLVDKIDMLLNLGKNV